MIIELNATEIIACAVDKHIKKNVRTNKMSIRIKHIQDIARTMEDEIPTLLTNCDMIAIEDCQYTFKKYMTINSSSLQIKQIKKVSPQLSRYLPKQEIYIKIFDKI